MYRLVYQREATRDQIEASLALVQAAADEPAPVPPATVADWKYGYGEYDEPSQQLRGFVPLPYFSGKAWQGGPNWPDSKLGWVQLTAEGGHAGNDRKHAAVRRWTAPADMRVAIESQLAHATRQGDGVRAFLVHSRRGLLKSAEVHNSQARLDVPDLEIRTGDTLDLVVDIGGGLNNDQFTWQAEIKQTSTAESQTATTWNSQRDFTGPATARLGAWEQLAQVLLSANEFVFID
jgi:hypothetical protein